MENPSVVGVRFSKVGKVYNFDATKVPEIRPGDHVVVETSRGWQLGEVAQIISDQSQPSKESLKPIDRLATPRDLVTRQIWKNKEGDVVTACQKKVGENKLTGIKILAAEYSFDGSRLSIMYSSENEDKVNLKALRQEMQRAYRPAQVDLRQIGPRDVAKLLGGMGACGLETRCCSKFLTDFNSISIRMAKAQGISLTPSEITGMCGRLRCCLMYEYEQYKAARQGMPKRNKRVVTPLGEGKVVDFIPLKEAVVVDIPEIGEKEFSKHDLQPLAELEAFKKKAETPCNKGNGGCNCQNGEKKNK